MILKRKIYKKLLEWKNGCQGKKALLIEGARRIWKVDHLRRIWKKRIR